LSRRVHLAECSNEIMTVLGPIPPEELGFASMHEHILFDATVLRRRYEALLPQEALGIWGSGISLENVGLIRGNLILARDNLVVDDEELMAAELEDFKASGGSAVVDMSGIGLRLNVGGIQRISRRTGVHVVTTTGFYTEDSWPEPFREMTVEQFAAHMTREIEEGIEDTGVRAGHIKAGITDLSENQRRLLKAIVQVADRTGVSVTIHPGDPLMEPGNDGRRIADVLIREGMEPERIIIAHGDGYLVERDVRTLISDPDAWGLRLDYHKELMDRGVNLGIDCFGHWWEPELLLCTLERDWQRLAGLVALVDAGYSSQIVLGTDTFVRILTRRFGGAGYCRLTDYVVPTLKELGVSDHSIRQLTMANPARLLARRL
jgi:phosphotriesterase-related protein